ncbi:MAG: sigma-70 family RNA polymerase sigma factor [Anaerolineaceae bacterium]|nr:sigma-70 family RNA polymerase sigma factor [Anaerolineaceae bacterium]
MRNYKNFSPTQLVEACRQQDYLAWNELVTRYERLVYTVPLRYGLPQAEAEDVFQTVWLALLNHLDALEQPERVAAWLVTTARRETWSRRRGADFERDAGVTVEQLDNPNEEDTSEEMMVQYERQTAVRRALSRLEERCQRLLKLLYYTTEKPEYTTIANELDIPVGSIGPTRARCLEKLRKEMEE